MDVCLTFLLNSGEYTVYRVFENGVFVYCVNNTQVVESNPTNIVIDAFEGYLSGVRNENMLCLGEIYTRKHEGCEVEINVDLKSNSVSLWKKHNSESKCDYQYNALLHEVPFGVSLFVLNNKGSISSWTSEEGALISKEDKGKFESPTLVSSSVTLTGFVHLYRTEVPGCSFEMNIECSNERTNIGFFTKSATPSHLYSFHHRCCSSVYDDIGVSLLGPTWYDLSKDENCSMKVLDSGEYQLSRVISNCV